MTFEQALTALKQGKKVTRNIFSISNYETKYIEQCGAYFRLKVTYKNGKVFETDTPPTLDDIFADDWEIAEKENTNLKSDYEYGYEEGYTAGYNKGKESVEADFYFKIKEMCDNEISKIFYKREIKGSNPLPRTKERIIQ